jgi:hypothetical protein
MMPRSPEPSTIVTVAVNQLTWDAVDLFDDLLDGLEALGLDGHVQSPRNGNYSQGGFVIDEAVAVSLIVGGAIAKSALSALEEVAREFFTRKFRQAGKLDDGDPQIVEIHGSRGEILSQIEIRQSPVAPRRKKPTDK